MVNSATYLHYKHHVKFTETNVLHQTSQKVILFAQILKSCIMCIHDNKLSVDFEIQQLLKYMLSCYDNLKVCQFSVMFG